MTSTQAIQGTFVANDQRGKAVAGKYKGGFASLPPTNPSSVRSVFEWRVTVEWGAQEGGMTGILSLDMTQGTDVRQTMMQTVSEAATKEVERAGWVAAS